MSNLDKKPNNLFSKKQLPENRNPKKNLFIVFLIAVSVLLSIYILKDINKSSHQVYFSEFLNLIDDENILWENIHINYSDITASFSLNIEKLDKNQLLFYQTKFKKLAVKDASSNVYKVATYSPTPLDLNFIQYLHESGIPFKSTPPSNNYFMNLLFSILPWIIIFGLFWFFMFRQIQGSGNKALSFGRSRARLILNNQKKITFKDVAGVDEAKEDLVESVDFLKNPGKYHKLGARIPKGILLIGPPGTGKTLLARSVAGESNRPFFSISGSEFVEMFVGVGASRVRDLFEQGKKHSPCIIFIDELDAVGRTRGSGFGGGHDEREQTLNQMLVEMDGFNTNETVIIMAATNRPDVLDPALLRPGRFDRHIFVSKPDIKGREEILNIHLKKISLEKDINIKEIAQGTPGFSGADLANLVNESAIVAGRKNKQAVDQSDFDYAKDKIIMGAERKTMIISAKEKMNTAYHESGHALLAYLLPNSNSLHKVSIIPRGRALGVTQTLPTEDRYTLSKQTVLEEIMVMLGGRIAEIYKFGEKNVTNGCSNDIEKATLLARSMVTEWGMGDMGPIYYEGDEQNPYAPKKGLKLSQDFLSNIDKNIQDIISDCYKKAKNLIYENSDKLELLSETLIEKESLNKHEIEALFKKGKISDQKEEEIPKEAVQDRQNSQDITENEQSI